MLLKSLCSTILVLSFSFAEASENLTYFDASTLETPALKPAPKAAPKKVVPKEEAPVPAPRPRRITPGSTDFSNYMPDDTNNGNGGNGTVEIEAPVPAPRPPRPRPKPVEPAPPVVNNPPADDGGDSEVVITVPDDPGNGDDNGGNDDDQGADPVVQAPTLYDLTNCKYGTRCWNVNGDERKVNRMKQIIANVDYINKIHGGTKFDPRYLLCTGWRESRYNPGALGGAGERGMFQVMARTGVSALKQGVKLEGFKEYQNKPETYMTKMANSTLAQTELSYLVLKSKAAILKSQGTPVSDVFSNHTASIAKYQLLATRYNGDGPAARAYGAAIANCLRCMRRSDSLPDVHKDFKWTSIDGCLTMATK